MLRYLNIILKEGLCLPIFTCLVLAAVALMSVVAIAVPVQEANAQDTTFPFKQKQSNECNGFAGCSNSATITFGRHNLAKGQPFFFCLSNYPITIRKLKAIFA